MAQITINEISQNYTYNIGTSSFCTVALPITASWGPGYVDPNSLGLTKSEVLESTAWRHFAATQEGLEAFVSTYRGPAANYRIAKDYSYQMAMTLLTSGYDVDVCRLCPGTYAQATITSGENNSLTFRAKYPGTFGNTLLLSFNKVANKNYWNLIVYVVDSTGVKSAVENVIFTLEVDHATDTILYIDEVESDFLSFIKSGTLSDSSDFGDLSAGIQLGATAATKGADRAADGTADEMLTEAITLATARYATVSASAGAQYLEALNRVKTAGTDVATAATIRYNEWLYTNVIDVYGLLQDKLAYNPNRIISPGWDDQNITAIDGSTVSRLESISPIHVALLNTAYLSRCATAYIDIPKCLPRSAVYNESNGANEGYAQKLARYVSPRAVDVSGTLYQTHSALFAPWGQYRYVGTSKQNTASPAFLALVIQRAMVLNQSLQYEWIMPTSRKHNLSIGKLDYSVPKAILDEWQTLEGVGVNVITNIPDMGISVWGNSTLYEVPPATYQALANLSTRLIVNAIENVAYRTGVSITFQYNNDEAYSKFYAGCVPILDTMKNSGALIDYSVRMSADLDALGTVKANSVIGKIFIIPSGVINDITIDLIALPPSTDLSQLQ